MNRLFNARKASKTRFEFASTVNNLMVDEAPIPAVSALGNMPTLPLAQSPFRWVFRLRSALRLIHLVQMLARPSMLSLWRNGKGYTTI